MTGRQQRGPTDGELAAWTGRVHRRVSIGGMSGASVQRLLTDRGSFALKRDVTPNERRFYDHHAARLREHGVDSPHVVASGDGWLLLEWVENDLPEVRWGPDDAVVAMLARLPRERATDRALRLGTDLDHDDVEPRTRRAG